MTFATRMMMVVAAALALAGTACKSDEPRSLILAELSAEPGLTGISDVDVRISSGTAVVAHKAFAWQVGGDGLLHVGVYIPGNVTGTVTVQAIARDASHAQIGMSTNTVAVQVGKASAHVPLVIVAASAPDGSTTDGGDSDARVDTGVDGGSPQDRGGLIEAGPADAPAEAHADAGGGDVPARSWSTAQNLENDLVTSSYWPTVAIDPAAGNVLVAWTEGSGVGLKRYDAALGTWSATNVLDAQGSSADVTVAMGAGGHALVVWRQDPNSVSVALAGLWGAHSENGGVTWSTPVQIHNGKAYSNVALGMSRAGDARVAWDESNGTTRSLWSAYFLASTGAWAGVAQVKLGSDIYERQARIAVASQGTGLLTWLQRDDGIAAQDSVWGTSFAAVNSALAPQLLETYDADVAYEPTAAINEAGTLGLVTWDQRATPSFDLMINQWTPATGWKGSEKVLTADVGAPAAAIDSSSTTTLVWTQPLTNSKWNMMAARRLSGGAWGAPVPLETTNQAPGQTDEYPYGQVAADAAGNVHVLWRRKVAATGSTFAAVVRRFAVGTGWQPEQVLGTKTGLTAFMPGLAVAPDGRAAATFYYADPDQTGAADAYNIFASLFR